MEFVDFLDHVSFKCITIAQFEPPILIVLAASPTGIGIHLRIPSHGADGQPFHNVIASLLECMGKFVGDERLSVMCFGGELASAENDVVSHSEGAGLQCIGDRRCGVVVMDPNPAEIRTEARLKILT